MKRILCVSEKIREITGLVVRDTSKLVTVHSGIDLSRFEGKVNTGILHREYNLEKDVKIVANVAALAPHKDYFTFVDTACRLLSERRDIVVMIIGDGPEKNAIENYIATKKCGDRLIMTGFRKDIPDILPELDVMLITSETEGLGTAILDAFACRVPVVATEAGGIPEIVVHMKSGLLAPVKDSVQLAANVLKLLNDNQLCDQIRKGALQHLQEFTRESTAQKTLNEYRKLVS